MGAIQIKNVPEHLHDEIRSRAAAKGMTVSDYMLDLAKRDLTRPTVREWVAMVRAGWDENPPRGDWDTAEILRQERQEREEELLRAMGYDSLPDPDDENNDSG